MQGIKQIAKFNSADSVINANEWLGDATEKGYVVESIQSHTTYAGEGNNPVITIIIIYIK